MSCVSTINKSNKSCGCGSIITNQVIQEHVRNELILASNVLREEILTLLQRLDSEISVLNILSIETTDKLDLLLAK